MLTEYQISILMHINDFESGAPPAELCERFGESAIIELIDIEMIRQTSFHVHPKSTSVDGFRIFAEHGNFVLADTGERALKEFELLQDFETAREGKGIRKEIAILVIGGLILALVLLWLGLN